MTDTEVIERARELEATMIVPWEWSDIPASPAQLMRLVVEGKISVVGRGKRGQRLYHTNAGGR